MPRIRTIKPEFWSDEKLSHCEPVVRLVFLGLIGMADDCGRLLDNIKVIDAFIFPSTSDSARDAIAKLSRMNRIRSGLTKSGQSVIQIANWDRHQKVDKPNYLTALPEIVEAEGVTAIRDAFANDSRPIRESASTLPTTYDLRSTTNDQYVSAANAADIESPEGELRDWLRWWNSLKSKQLVPQGVNEEEPSRGVTAGWKRVRRSKELQTLLSDRDALEREILASTFCQHGSWFTLGKLFGGTNRDGEYVVKRLLDGGYRTSHQGSLAAGPGQVFQGPIGTMD